MRSYWRQDDSYRDTLLADVRDQYIDNVDELTPERLHNQIEFEEVLDSINSEIGQRTMDLEYLSFMTSWKKRITWIMYQDMYASKVVRKAVVNSSKCCNTADIIDYDSDE